jgi:hypothetical protein
MARYTLTALTILVQRTTAGSSPSGPQESAASGPLESAAAIGGRQGPYADIKSLPYVPRRAILAALIIIAYVSRGAGDGSQILARFF